MNPFRTRTWISGLGFCLAAASTASACSPMQSAATHAAASPARDTAGRQPLFRRIATFPAYLNTSVDAETVAEILASGQDGKLLVYTDSETEHVGFIDITDPAHPAARGAVAVGGEPTSIAVTGDFALTCVNTSANFVDTSGNLLVIDLAEQRIVATLPLGGQPDSIAISPDGRYAVIAIENELDADLGPPPQAPAGYVVIVDLVGAPEEWTTRRVELVGLPDVFPDDPEPEFVDVSSANVAVVTLQENNHLVLIDLESGQVLADYSAGTVDLEHVDTEKNGRIEATGTLRGVPREPDAVAVTSESTFATANEGDLVGGSRGFTTWSNLGAPLFDAGNTIEAMAMRVGHYPERRSSAKGTEPEGLEYGEYGGRRYLFVGTERANLVFVYRLFLDPTFGNTFPVLQQVLPTGAGPEGMHAIPGRNLFVVASEIDDRERNLRSTVMIYELGDESTYPTLVSADRPGTSLPIPWGSLSGLTAGGSESGELYAVHDAFYDRTRIFTVDVSRTPAVLTRELELRDTAGVLRGALERLRRELPKAPKFDPADLVHADKSVHLDAEAIAFVPAAEGGTSGFWLASEGDGRLVRGVSDPEDHPFERPNLLVRVTSTGEIAEVVMLPLELMREQESFGLEGLAVVGRHVFVAFQRAWKRAGDPVGHARIGRYDTSTGAWTFALYPVDTADPVDPQAARGWVGLSELTHVGGGKLAVIERDNQGGPDAALKRIYAFSTADVAFEPLAESAQFAVVSKQLVLDLLAADVYGPGAGPIPEKQEGLAVLADGTTWIVNDNDGVHENNGETRLLDLGRLFD